MLLQNAKVAAMSICYDNLPCN